MVKKLNKKGFTLIELLAVVVIMLAISVMAVSSISAAIERNKNKQNDVKIGVIISYAKLYFDENKNSLLNSSGRGEIKLDVLELADSEKIDVYDEEFNGVVCYSYNSLTDPRGNNVNFVYEFDGNCNN